MSSHESCALKARYVFPVDRPPLADGVVTVAAGRIVAVGENLSGRTPRDLGSAAIVPGLVNAHTHLEFSDLAAPLGEQGMPFADWIRAVVSRRRAVPDEQETAGRVRSAVAAGLRESHAAGVTHVGEIATAGWSPEPFAASPVGATVFRELIGLSQSRIDTLLQTAEQHVAGAGEDENALALRRGVSPHAPYTVSPELVRRVALLSGDRGFPVAMHLAETMEELELLASGSGPLVELLRELDAWDPSAIPRGIRPLDYLKLLAQSHRALVVHGNYLARSEIEFVAARAERMAIVYCPRTHARFGHGRYPLAELLQRGACVALGTDSRASNPDLDLLAEMRFIAAHHADVPLETVLRLGTLGGAEALGIARECGTLSPGKRADLAIIVLPEAAHAADPHELLLHTDSRVAGTVVSGE
jgi:cytosine/adenosine deaminase-related metal-dependent hydrolase